MTRTIALALLVATSTSLAAQSKPVITPKDFGKWEQLGAARLAPRGDWAAIGISRVSEENELRIRGGPRDTTIVVTYGANPAFSADGQWIAYAIGMSPKERERLTKEKKPVKNSLEFRNLSTGQTVAVADINTFAFSPDARFISMARYAPEGKKTTEVLVQNLATGARLSFSNVGEQAWSEIGALLALTIDTDGGLGNAVQLYDAGTGTLRVLESSPGQYRALTWRAKSTDLAVLKTHVEKEFKDTAHVLLAWTSLATPEFGVVRLDPASAQGFPAAMRIADYRRPSWSRDGRVLFFGIKKREPTAEAMKKGEEKVSEVEIWHPNDVRMLRQQMSTEQTDGRRTLLTALRIAENKIVPIGTDLFETAVALEGGRYATETDIKPYAWGQKFGRDDQDVWVVDLTSGERKKVLEKVRHYYGANPSGTKLTWSDGKDFWAVDLTTGQKTNLTAPLTSTKKADFVNHDDDHPNNVPPVNFPAGWAKDGSYIVYDTYDAWSVAPDGSGGKRLTDGAKDGIIHRMYNFAPVTLSPAERAFDLTKPLYFVIAGKKSKQGGFARRTADGGVQRLILADASIGGLTRAESADVYMFTRQRYDESPNLYLGSDVTTAKKITDTNPFQKDYAWSKVELFDYKSSIGVPLQALLYYPANYDAAKKYPMIVYTYEILTPGLHRYIVPRETDYYNATVFTQNGYFVMMPDIVFRPREPGLAAQQSVEPAIKSVIARGLVDPARVGHVGHSQGGYEAAFLGTHSKMFATTIAGSGITDMISFAGQLHWNGGGAEFDHWETGQFRMEVAPWEDMKAMIDNSPLAAVHQMPAKSMLLEVGGDDGTVDPRQGSLFYNYARRAGKQVVMLMYPGEGHGLSKKENQLDYERRILQWFGHYLKGDPAAKWITDGQSALERKAIIDANKDAPTTPIRP
jgi:dipeptidyl aminopeptidase/acylaminoacyl peptidase